MACNCKDENGSLLDKCIGVCTQKSCQVDIEDQKRAVDLEDKVEYLLGVWDLRMKGYLGDAKLHLEEHWKDGFAQGFELARSIYE